MWERMDALVARAPDRAALRHHGLELFAARARRRAGLELDADLAQAQRVAAMRAVAVPVLLRRIRAIADGPLVLMKGPEAAASYPAPDCRVFKDLDLLTPQPERVHAALIGAGFVQTATGATDQHLAELQWPGIPLTVEIHRTIHGVLGAPVPPTETLLSLTVPSRTRVAGVDAFEPSAHAVLLAIHAWAHGPLERLGSLFDVAAVLADGDARRADQVAREWGCPRLWETTTACLDALLCDARAPLAQRVFARHLVAGSEPRVLDTYVGRLAGPLWGLPLSRTWRGLRSELARTALPYEGERWGAQWSRARRAIGNTFSPLSAYRA